MIIIIISLFCSSITVASLGEHDISVEEGTEQHIPVGDIIYHSPYRSALNSLALVRLSRPARFNSHVRPIPLASRCALSGVCCSASGWGTTVPNHSELDVKKCRVFWKEKKEFEVLNRRRQLCLQMHVKQETSSNEKQHQVRVGETKLSLNSFKKNCDFKSLITDQL